MSFVVCFVLCSCIPNDCLHSQTPSSSLSPHPSFALRDCMTYSFQSPFDSAENPPHSWSSITHAAWCWHCCTPTHIRTWRHTWSGLLCCEHGCETLSSLPCCPCCRGGRCCWSGTWRCEVCDELVCKTALQDPCTSNTVVKTDQRPNPRLWRPQRM